jgi:hypothetical protein
MEKAQLKKAAWLSAAGTLAATGVVGVAQGTAHAAVSYYCEGYNPTQATSVRTVESYAAKTIGAMYYPKFSLRWGVIDGNVVLWTRESTAESGYLDLDWGPSANNSTHWKCSVTTDYATPNYTTGVSYGFYSSAYYFRPCVMRRSWTADAGSQYAYGPWECGGWATGG